jgi:hypothetical protein
MNVAVVKTGPGVACPTAIASSSCASVSQCKRSREADHNPASENNGRFVDSEKSERITEAGALVAMSFWSEALSDFPI